MSAFDSDPIYRSLPCSPDLGRLRDEAKSLKKLCASGNAGAIAFVNFHLRQGHERGAAGRCAIRARALVWVQELDSASKRLSKRCPARPRNAVCFCCSPLLAG